MATSAVFLKTQLCKFHQDGCCKQGVHCKFAHDIRELVKVPPEFRKVSMCKLWLRGTCPFASNTCNFAHGEGTTAPSLIPAELNVSSNFQQHPPSTSSSLSSEFEKTAAFLLPQEIFESCSKSSLSKEFCELKDKGEIASKKSCHKARASNLPDKDSPVTCTHVSSPPTSSYRHAMKGRYTPPPPPPRIYPVRAGPPKVIGSVPSLSVKPSMSVYDLCPKFRMNKSLTTLSASEAIVRDLGLPRALKVQLPPLTQEQLRPVLLMPHNELLLLFYLAGKVNANEA